MAKLVIVESPSKAKTIKKYLGGDYEVIASQGHIIDLPSSKFAVVSAIFKSCTATKLTKSPPPSVFKSNTIVI